MGAAIVDSGELVSDLRQLIEGELKIRVESDSQELDLDSYTMMMVILFIEEHAGVQLDMDKLDFDAFTSLTSLVSLVRQAA
jgi:acyl carrier protein